MIGSEPFKALTRLGALGLRLFLCLAIVNLLWPAPVYADDLKPGQYYGDFDCQGADHATLEIYPDGQPGQYNAGRLDFTGKVSGSVFLNIYVIDDDPDTYNADFQTWRTRPVVMGAGFPDGLLNMHAFPSVLLKMHQAGAKIDGQIVGGGCGAFHFTQTKSYGNGPAKVGYLCPVDERVSGSSARDRLIKIQDKVRNDPKYMKEADGTTHCNAATTDIACQMIDCDGPAGADLLGPEPLLANAIASNLARDRTYWHEVTPGRAQAMADKGGLVIAAAHAEGHGHVATVRPRGVPGDKPHPGTGPLINQVGTHCMIAPASNAFYGEKPRYYAPA